ncbi:hypothetical protein [Acinetobacter johnsonii]|jgi:hypothetical protein|uniref:hypothetical protein n=1 Tax=Acinetobacter johnsonii TaxID=40214 RepID=UPI001F38B0A0|nr:hypothetical protein [Acinetobacter johnsonii]UIZ94203.1 hypothetical protein GBN67_04215 [Acinetobacter johnsonii]
MSEVLSVIKEMVFNNSLLLNAIVFIIIFNIFLMLSTYIYNKIYIKIYKDDFFDLFFGKENGLVFRGAGGDLVVVAYWFLMRYSFEVFSARKTRFPSYKDVLNKPFYMTPNAYKENIDLFKIERNSWLVVNLTSLYITYFLAILFLLYLVFFEIF